MPSEPYNMCMKLTHACLEVGPKEKKFLIAILSLFSPKMTIKGFIGQRPKDEENKMFLFFDFT